MTAVASSAYISFEIHAMIIFRIPISQYSW